MTVLLLEDDEHVVSERGLRGTGGVFPAVISLVQSVVAIVGDNSRTLISTARTSECPNLDIDLGQLHHALQTAS